MHKSLEYVSDYELESACKDAPWVAPSRVNWKIFAVLVVRVHHVVLTRSFKLFKFFTFIFAVLWSWVGTVMQADYIRLILYSNFEIFVTVVTGVGLRQITLRSYIRWPPNNP